MRQMEIDRILQDLYQSNISLKENNLYLTASMVKEYLQKRGIPKSEQELLKITQYFQEWQNTFREYSNLHTYVDAGFNLCIKNGEIPSANICMSLSLDSGHINQGVKIIFDYLARQNIAHKSEIKNVISTDGIVIRLANKEDAIKLQTFINSSKYLQEGILPINSFYPDDNKVGYTYNGSTSYNAVLSHIIANYINRMYEFGIELKDININSFYQYINAFSQDKNNISELPFIGQNKEKEKDASLILELLKNSLGSNNINDFFKFYDWVQNNNNAKSNDYEDKEELFKEFVLTTLKKYPKGFDDSNPELSGLDYINHFLKGNINGVTRDNNLRERIKNNLTIDDIVNLLKANHIPGADISKKMNIYVKMIMLNEMIRCSEIRFPNRGLDQVNEFIKTGSLKFITGSIDNARNLAKTLGPEGIDILFRSVGVSDIYRYAEEYVVNTEQNKYQK